MTGWEPDICHEKIKVYGIADRVGESDDARASVSWGKVKEKRETPNGSFLFADPKQVQ